MNIYITNGIIAQTKGKRYIDAVFGNTGFIRTDGTFSTSANGWKTTAISLNDLSSCTYTLNMSNTGCMIAFYRTNPDGLTEDQRKTSFISSVSVIGTGGKSSGDVDFSSAKKAGANFILFSFYYNASIFGDMSAKYV